MQAPVFMSEYTVRKLKIGNTQQMSELALAAGELYSRTVVSFWRTVRNKGLWLKPSSMMRWHNSDKAQRLGMKVEIQDEKYTSQTCPSCGKRHKPNNRTYNCLCGFEFHRDGVGSINIRRKYLGCFDIPVVGVDIASLTQGAN